LRDRYGKGLEALRYLEALEAAAYEIEQRILFIVDMDRDDIGLLRQKGPKEKRIKKLDISKCIDLS
jgi:hypothetical protein